MSSLDIYRVIFYIHCIYYYFTVLFYLKIILYFVSYFNLLVRLIDICNVFAAMYLMYWWFVRFIVNIVLWIMNIMYHIHLLAAICIYKYMVYFCILQFCVVCILYWNVLVRFTFVLNYFMICLLMYVVLECTEYYFIFFIYCYTFFSW